MYGKIFMLITEGLLTSTVFITERSFVYLSLFCTAESVTYTIKNRID